MSRVPSRLRRLAVDVTSGGLACVAGMLVLAAAVPEFARYEPPEDTT